VVAGEVTGTGRGQWDSRDLMIPVVVPEKPHPPT
jgi:hypothetical protein